MKLVYLITALFNSGGTERVLHNKVCEFVRLGGYDITIITTDQGSATPFFVFPESVHIIDLGINYSSVYTKSPIQRSQSICKKKRLHLKRLSELLCKIKPDVTITIYPSGGSVSLAGIKDGSKKVVEFHSDRFYRLHRGYKGFHQVVAKYRTWQDYRFIKKFDEIVFLTKEGASQWDLPNMKVIPNAALSGAPTFDFTPPIDTKRVIAVGRLVYEKGFDRLIEAWSLLPRDILSEWQLDIFGAGELHNELNKLIFKKNVTDSIRINAPTKQIFEEYLKSSFLVMTSHSEGLPMVLIEAMSCGLPVVSFDFPCGPKEVIENEANGFLVENGNVHELSKKMEALIRNKSLRDTFSKKAERIRDDFSEKKIMNMWVDYFAELTSR